MKQPELGKKISELRKAKGLTQEELVGKCNLSVRTLIRIEAGEVMPRSYTIRTIFGALDYNYYDSSENLSNRFSKTALIISNWLEQINIYLIDLFNLKTNVMKKISILSIILITIGISLFVLCTESKAQKAEKVIKIIKNSEIAFNKWLNNGQIDSLFTLYRDDACVIPFSCGKTEMYKGLKPLIDHGYEVIEYNPFNISVSDSIAVEKFYAVYRCLGIEHKQKGMKEWRFTNGKWLIVNHMMADYQ